MVSGASGSGLSFCDFFGGTAGPLENNNSRTSIYLLRRKLFTDFAWCEKRKEYGRYSLIAAPYKLFRSMYKSICLVFASLPTCAKAWRVLTKVSPLLIQFSNKLLMLVPNVMNCLASHLIGGRRQSRPACCRSAIAAES